MYSTNILINFYINMFFIIRLPCVFLTIIWSVLHNFNVCATVVGLPVLWWINCPLVSSDIVHANKHVDQYFPVEAEKFESLIVSHTLTSS